MLILRMVIEGAISMRAAARISGLIAEFFGGHRQDGVSHATVQNYLLRVGLDQLQHGVKVSANGVWIMDHMIAAGSLKCLIVIEIEIDVFRKLQRPLEHHDANVLALIPTEVSNGSVVQEQLNELAIRRGVPAAILCDRGSDLKKGGEMFQQKHPETLILYDIVHLVSRLIGKKLEKEERFKQYRQASCVCANKLRQNQLAHLKPPTPKTKARYMNLDPEIRWGRRALWLLDRVKAGNLTARQVARLDRKAVQEQLGWLEEYRNELDQWNELSKLGQQCCTVVREHGYSSATPLVLKSRLGEGSSSAGKEMIAELLQSVEQQCTCCKVDNDRWPGSSEVLESLIGKGKRLLGTSQNNNSLTGQILSIAASTINFGVQSLRESLDRCRIKHLRSWIADHIILGTHVSRSEDLREAIDGTKLAQAIIPPTPSF
jgi:hypothetical protein